MIKMGQFRVAKSDGTQTRSFMYISDCVKGIDMITHCDELIATLISLGLQRIGYD